MMDPGLDEEEDRKREMYIQHFLIYLIPRPPRRVPSEMDTEEHVSNSPVE